MEGEANPQVQGIDQLKSKFDNLFRSSPNLHAEILIERIKKNEVFHREQVTGRMG